MKDYRLFSSLTEKDTDKKQADVNLTALVENYRQIEKYIHQNNRDTKLIAVVKADAYGHGAPACVKTLLACGCRFFAVSCLDEAITVRQISDEENLHPEILIFGETSPANVQYLSDFDLIQALLSKEYTCRLLESAKKSRCSVRVHLAADTGMSRIGFPARTENEIAESVSEIATLCQDSCLSVEGAFTHFARADEESEDAKRFTDQQSQLFRHFCRSAEQVGISIPFRHACNSAASVLRPEDHLDGVRLGLILYGIPPIRECRIPLKPVMRVTTEIIHLHPLRAGESLGYGGTYIAPSDRMIATLPIGYADGWLRHYAGSTVILQTKTGRYPIPLVGRICMDQCMADVTGTDASVGDRILLFGEEDCPVSAISDRAGTIPYETVCLISSRILRKYTV